MFKKITLTFTAIFFISLIGFAITLPLGIKTTLNNIENLLQITTLTPEKIEIDQSVETLKIDFSDRYYYYNDIVVKQSPNNTAYLELYGTGEITYAFANKISVSYPDEKTAKIYTERAFGTFSFDKETINKSIVKQLQNYPDAILYVPTNMNIQIDNIEDIYYFENITFQNKEQMFAQLKNKQYEERIRMEAEHLLQQRQQQEEKIRAEAEHLLQQQQSAIEYTEEYNQYYP